MHLEFDKTQHSRASKPLAERLSRIPMEAVSGFLLKALAAEKQIMDTLRQLRPVYEDQLLARSDIKTVRIAKNHAQLMALTAALVPIIGLDKVQHACVHALLEEMAAARQQTINLDHPLVEAFWEQFDYLNGKYLKNGGQIKLDHSGDEKVIAVNLVEYEAACSKAGLHLPCEPAALKKLLKNAVQRKFVSMKTLKPIAPCIVGCFRPAKPAKAITRIKRSSL